MISWIKIQIISRPIVKSGEAIKTDINIGKEYINLSNLEATYQKKRKKKHVNR